MLLHDLKHFLIEDIGQSVSANFKCSVPNDSELRITTRSIDTMQDLAFSLQQLVGDVVIRRNNAKPVRNKWTMTEISGYGIHLQLSTPAMTPREIVKMGDVISKWTSDLNLRLEDECEILVTDPNIKNLDPVKLVYLLGISSVSSFADMFSSISYDRGEALIHKVKYTGLIPASYTALYKSSYNLLESKFGFNFANLSSNQLSFAMKLNNLDTKLVDLITAINGACDGSIDKSKYLQVVAKATRGTKTSMPKSLPDLPPEITRLGLANPEISHMWADLFSGSKIHKTDLIMFVIQCLRTTAKTHQRLSNTERRYLQSLLKAEKITDSDIHKHLDTMDQVRFYREFKV